MHLATQRKFLCKFSLCPPATNAGPFDQGLKARVVCPSFLLLLTLYPLRWPNTVFAHAFADAIQHVHKDFKKQTCRQ